MNSFSLGISPCPNDTFAFHALLVGAVGDNFDIDLQMADIEQLNQRAMSSDLDVTKLSLGALAEVEDKYVPIRTGAALGFGVGPLVVSKRSFESVHDLAGCTVAIPGYKTTAFLLLSLALGDQLKHINIVEKRYDEILKSVENAEVDAGLIIHESRFTYQDHGLTKVVDLGEWWQSKTSLPVPLAVICVRRSMDTVLRLAIEKSIRLSVGYAFANPDASSDFVEKYAQEMSTEVRKKHINLYVNKYSINLNDEAMKAIDALQKAASSNIAAVSR